VKKSIPAIGHRLDAVLLEDAVLLDEVGDDVGPVAVHQS
jgi:hypothetical protein